MTVYPIQKDIRGLEFSKNDLSLLTVEKCQLLCRFKGDFHPDVPAKWVINSSCIGAYIILYFLYFKL